MSARVAGWLLLVLIAVGSLLLWIGIPAGCLWLASTFTESGAEHFLYALPMTIAGMAVFAPCLVWLNRLFMRIRYSTRAEPDEDGEEQPLRGPLEPFLVGSLSLALVAMLVWFFVFAENPPSCAGN